MPLIERFSERSQYMLIRYNLGLFAEELTRNHREDEVKRIGIAKKTEKIYTRLRAR